MTIAHELPLWQTDPDWRDNRIASTARGAMLVRWLFAVAFIGISVPLVLVLPEELADGNWPALIAVLFPLVGVGMLYSAIVRTLEWRRVGRLALVLDPFPGSLAGDVGGSIEVPLRYRGNRRFSVALACSRIYETGSGDSRSTQEKVLWDRNGIADARPSMTGTRLKFRFQAPDDLTLARHRPSLAKSQRACRQSLAWGKRGRAKLARIYHRPINSNFLLKIIGHVPVLLGHFD